jgi:hypothetical protein
MASCETCQLELSVESRQLAGCPWAPAVPARSLALVRAWSGLGYAGAPPTTCPGYTTQLPEVIETARARHHWLRGNLAALCGGPAPDALLERIEILDGAARELDAWSVTPRSKGGGAEG